MLSESPPTLAPNSAALPKISGVSHAPARTPDAALSIENISKCYRMFRKPEDRLKQMLFGRWKRYYTDFWAVRDVSFEVGVGSTLGVIGANGSGKSTLLQMIAGIVAPTEGTCKRRGRVGALIELGSGFNPEFSGRENARLQCSILGLEAARIDDIVPRIREFSELGDFFDRPVKIYSSGMFVRLAFACQTVLEPQILLVDEVLAVGDSYFQLKCFEQIKKMKDSGMTILLVTHDASAIKKLCDHVVWMSDGAIHRRGCDVNHIVDDYMDFQKNRLKADMAPASEDQAQHAAAERQAGRIRSVQVEDAAGAPCALFKYGAPLRVRVTYELFREVPACVMGIAFFDATKFALSALNTQLDKVAIPSTPGTHSCILEVQKLPFLGATYNIDVGLFENQVLGRVDYVSKAAEFKIQSGYVGEGLMILDHQWSSPHA